MIGKNVKRSEMKLVPYTAEELLRMPADKMNQLIFGTGGGRQARKGVREEIGRIISEWRKS